MSLNPGKLLLAAAMLVGVVAAAPAMAQQGLSPEQKSEVEKIVREYLTDNPEVIVDAIRELRRRDEAAEAQKRDAALAEMHGKAGGLDPVMGNPDGDVSVVEFFDYRCGYCKRVFPDIQKLLKEDGNIRYVLKEWPILGDDSVYASRAALAVWLGQKEFYAPFHAAMMQSKGNLDSNRVMELAKSAGVDVEKMKSGLGDQRISKIIADNTRLAGELGVTGTPAFIFGTTLVPGAIDMATMKKLVAAAREK